MPCTLELLQGIDIRLGVLAVARTDKVEQRLIPCVRKISRLAISNQENIQAWAGLNFDILTHESNVSFSAYTQQLRPRDREPITLLVFGFPAQRPPRSPFFELFALDRSEEHTSELQSR